MAKKYILEYNGGKKIVLEGTILYGEEGREIKLTKDQTKVLIYMISKGKNISGYEGLYEYVKEVHDSDRGEVDCWVKNSLRNHIAKIITNIQTIAPDLSGKNLIDAETGTGYRFENIEKAYIEDSIESNLHDKVLVKLCEQYYQEYKNVTIDKFTGYNRGTDSDIRLIDVYRFPKYKYEKKFVLQYDGQKYWIKAPNGFGKTTFLKSILLSVIYDNVSMSEEEKGAYQRIRDYYGITKKFFPLMIEAKNIDFDKYEKRMSGEEFEDFMYSNLGIGEMDICSSKEFGRILMQENKERRLLLLIDGYDEVKDKDREKCVDFFAEKLIKKYENATVLITSRPMESGTSTGIRIKGHTMTYELSDLDVVEDEKDIILLIEKYIKFYDTKKRASEIYKEIRDNYFLRKLLISPFMVILVTLNYLADWKSEKIIKNVIEGMSTRFDYLKERGKVAPFLVFYEEIAYQMLCNNEISLLDRNGQEFVECINMIIPNRKKYEKNEYMNKSPDEIADILFINIGLVKRINSKVSFLAPEVLTIEFGARKLKSDIGRWGASFEDLDETYEEMLKKIFEELKVRLECIGDTYRYDILTILASYDFTGELSGGLIDKGDITPYFVEYILERCKLAGKEEQIAICRAIVNILNKSYGENYIAENTSPLNAEFEEERKALRDYLCGKRFEVKESNVELYEEIEKLLCEDL